MDGYRKRAQYHETDQMGVIHHASYILWMEEARTAFLNDIGVSYKAMEASGILSPVVELSVKYIRSVEFDDEVEVRITIPKYNGIILEVGYEIYDLTKDTLAATAFSRHCFLSEGRPVSLRKYLPEADARLTAQVEK